MNKKHQSGIAKFLYIIFLSLIGVLVWLFFFRKA